MLSHRVLCIFASPIGKNAHRLRGLPLLTPQELLTENQLLWNIIEASYDGLFITDNAGKVLYCNPAYLRISGLCRETIVGRTVADLIETGAMPDSCALEVVQTQKPITKIIDYFHGHAALITSVPVFNDKGELSRVLSNVRDITELTKTREQLQQAQSLKEEYQLRLRQTEKAGTRQEKLLAVSPVMENLLRLCERLAHVNSPVLIQGESGVGKDMLARYIHECWDIHENRPFIQLNCSAIPENLLESELFGYEPGAFTGALAKGKAGLFELANNGTLFLDEIGEMPLALQVKLLDTLHSGKIRHLGGTSQIDTNARIIAATNTNLGASLAQGKFRTDLYYRLNVIPIFIPPLRERREDIVPLLFHFLSVMNQKFHANKTLSAAAVAMLVNYSWPGNVRELRNIIENLVVMTAGDQIEDSALPGYVVQSALLHNPVLPESSSSYDLKECVASAERELISKALAEFHDLKTTARQLGIDLSTLVRKKRRYKL